MKTFIKKILPLKMVDFVKNLLSVYRQKDYTNKRTTNAVDYMDGIINLYKGNFTDDVFLKSGQYEENIQRVFKALIKKGDTVIDIGANIGIHTILMSKLAGDEGRVIAFEPIPHLIKRLNANLSLNNCRNVTISNYAIGNENKKITINAVNENDFNQGSSSVVVNEHLATGNVNTFKLDVDSRKLDHLCDEFNITKLNFIKMDIEGFEFFALKGMLDVLNKFRPSMIIEYNCDRLDFLKISNDDFKNLIGTHFDCYEISKRDYIDSSFSLDPFNFDRRIKSDLLIIPKILFGDQL
jgi:FkbM family methyltransferase